MTHVVISMRSMDDQEGRPELHLSLPNSHVSQVHQFIREASTAPSLSTVREKREVDGDQCPFLVLTPTREPTLMLK